MRNDITVTIATPGGGLTLSTSGPFEIVEFGVGTPRWRKTVVSGRYQSGRALVGAVRDVELMSITARVSDATWVAQQNRYGELVAAVSQFSYAVTVTINGHTLTYQGCEPADIVMVSGGTYNKIDVLHSEQTYQLTIPYNPAGVS